MEILQGLLYVNNVDVYVQYGVFLAEKDRGGHENYDALLKPSKTKEQVSINVREQDGEQLPAALNVKFEARDVTLYFGIEAANRAQFLTRRTNFIQFLRTGNGGWLNFNVPELNKKFRFYLKDFPEWEQTQFDNSFSFGRFKVMFREPDPTF
ncbi:MAG: hypothetical protein LBH32_01330 [Dysgonamonadaceae bacterium]|jgi:hypothetical protein|nr:hypothetical protein [Dysgonamonadaceae bacterium]